MRYIFLTLLMASLSFGAAITSTQSGDFSDTATWVGGVVPTNGDSWTVATGHTVTYDHTNSADDFVGVTITGTLQTPYQSGDANDYYLKCSADIGGAGTWTIGDDVNGFPDTATFTIDFDGTGSSVEGGSGLTVGFFCAEPTYTYVKLSALEAAGQTVLSVDTDVTSDLWSDGDTIWICNIDSGQDEEERVIAAGGIAATTITITAGLTAEKLEGSYVLLQNRNIKLFNTTSNAFNNLDNSEIALEVYSVIYVFNSCDENVISGGTYSGNSDVLRSSNSNTLSGGTYSGNTYVLNSSNSNTLSGGTYSGNGRVFFVSNSNTLSGGTYSGNNYILIVSNSNTFSGGTYSGNDYILHSCYSSTLSGGTYSGNTYVLNSCNSSTLSGGTYSGNTYVLNSSNSNTLSGDTYSGNGSVLFASNSNTLSGGTYSGNDYILNSSYSNTLSGGTYSGNTYLLSNSYSNILSDVGTSGAASENTGYNTIRANTWTYDVSYDHNEVVGAFKSWTKGGITTSQIASPPSGYTVWYEHACEDADFHAFRQEEISLAPGQSISVNGVMRIADGEDLSGDPPGFEIVSDANDPLTGHTALASTTIPVSDGTNTSWQTMTEISYTNSGTIFMPIKVRAKASHASADVDEAWTVTATNAGDSGSGTIHHIIRKRY